MRILILGGYGVFGGRLATLLSDLAEIDLGICGRDLGRAKAFCAAWTGKARVHPLALDRADIVAGLQAQRPDLIVDASGPFQDYGNDGYLVISACIDAGVDYLDFADAADFVVGVPEFKERAKTAGVFALSGVSSFPVLTAAVLREMTKTMDITSVEGGIAPSPYAGIGLNVMRAVIGYAGAPVKLQRGGKAAFGTGLAESMRYTVAVPGRLPLRNIHFSLVDVPDLQVIPPEYPTMTDIWMGAGPVPEILHRVLNVLARARARFRLPTMVPFSRLFYAVLNRMRFGEHRGGMFVRAEGTANGKSIERSWHLLAEGDDGPFIPSMAVEAIVRKLLAGQRPAAGARSGVRALELADYNALFAGRRIVTGFRQNEPADALYRQILGPVFTDLPPRVRQLHDSTESDRWNGVASIRRGRNPLARLVAALIGFPRAESSVPVSVTFGRSDGVERWTRTFGGKSFSSEQTCGTGKDQHLLVERFGVASFALALVIEEGRLLFVPRRWSLAGMPMPHWLLPRGDSFEMDQDGTFAFNVEIVVPLIGMIVAYRGTLEPA
ncbi:DUF4166 domain-containing protein [Sphingomonas sp. Tas61C01]|uniref:DUF4166 domain-containing protein n=1 Tax=Sphingomonas sp. Tas61C01 TaxID=3458297 RepID=UPI00403E60DC